MKKSFLLVVLLLLAFSVSMGVTRGRMEPIGLGFYPEIFVFEAVPNEVHKGGKATLEWESRGAAGLVLEARAENADASRAEIVAELPAKGHLEVHPSESTVYSLKCDTVLGLKCGNAELRLEVK